MRLFTSKTKKHDARLGRLFESGRVIILFKELTVRGRFAILGADVVLMIATARIKSVKSTVWSTDPNMFLEVRGIMIRLNVSHQIRHVVLMESVVNNFI